MKLENIKRVTELVKEYNLMKGMQALLKEDPSSHDFAAQKMIREYILKEVDLHTLYAVLKPYAEGRIGFIEEELKDI